MRAYIACALIPFIRHEYMNYKTACPICGKETLYVTPMNGLSYCFSPGCNYYLREGLDRSEKKERSPYLDEIRHFYNKAALYYHSSLDKRALGYLYARGLNDVTIKNLKIGYCPKGKSPLYNGQVPIEAGLSMNGEAFLADRVTFPYMYDDTTIVDIRGRSIRDDPLKYKSPFNGAYYRGADYPYNYHLHRENIIILTEGEIKADLAVQIGYPTMALPGMGIWKQGFRQQANQHIILLFDSQNKNVHSLRTAIEKAAMQLDGPKIATLPLFGEKKMDIDQFILTYGKTGFDIVVNSALPFNTWKRLQRV